MSILMKDSEEKWIGDIPRSWKVKRIKDDLESLNPIRIPLSSADRGLMDKKIYDYYGASGVIDKVENFLFDGTYLLIAEDGANLITRSKPLAFLAHGKFWVNNHAHILKPYFGDIRYYTYQLELIDYSLSVTGAAQPKLTQENLGRIKIVRAPYNEQKLIADFLDKQTLNIDSVIKTKEQQLINLEKLKKSIIHKAVTKGLDNSVEMRDSEIEWIGDIPKHWKIDRIKDLSKRITGGGTPKSSVFEYWDEGKVIWVTPTDFQDYENSKYINDSRRKITEKGLSSCSAELLPKNTLIMSSRASIGIPKLTSIPLSTNQGFISFIESDKLLNGYLYYCIESYLGKYYLTIANGTTFKEISPTLAKQENIPLPPKDEQEKLVEYLDIEVEKINTLKKNVSQQIEKLKEYKKSLIYEYVTGKKQVKE